MRLLMLAIFNLVLLGCGGEFRQRRTILEALVATNAPRTVVESTLQINFKISKVEKSHGKALQLGNASSWQRVVADKAQRAAAIGHTSTIDMQTYIFLDEHDRLIDFEIGAQ